MRSKMPWIDVERCDIAERCQGCKPARLCKHGAFQVLTEGNGPGGSCRVMIDLERCRLCGDCAHACELGAVKMV